MKLREDSTPEVKSCIGAFVLCAVFVLLACIFVPYLGVQHDEALFAGPLFHEHPKEYGLRAFKRDVPLMLLPYLGAAKTWLYSLVFKISDPGIWSIRLPVIVVGAVTLGVLFLLVRRIAGRTAALICCAILATDPIFILTTTFDWGPAAIQHLCWVAGLYLVLRGHQQNRAALTGLGFGFLGFGMWDKALFAWMLIGAATGVLIVFPAELRRVFTRRQIGSALLGFVIGALPLMLYNIRQPLKTFQGNTEFSLEGIKDKASLVKLSIEGSSLFGYMANEEWMKDERAARNMIERFSVALRSTAGERRTSLLFLAAVLSLLAAPLWWSRWRRPVFFILISLLAAWLQMALNRLTGGGVHHVVLLWPLPHILIAIAVAALASRFRLHRLKIAGLLGAVLVMSNLLVVNQYFSQFVRFGAAGVWTDAVLTLAEHFRRDPTGVVVTTDWGMFETVRLLGRGIDHMIVADDHLNREPDPSSRAAVEWMLSHERPRFIAHTAEFEVTEGATRRLIDNAAALGFRPETEARIADSNGRPVFEVLRFVKSGAR